MHGRKTTCATRCMAKDKCLAIPLRVLQSKPSFQPQPCKTATIHLRLIKSTFIPVATESNSGLSSLSNLAQTCRPASVMLIIAKHFERASARVHGFRHRLRRTRPRASARVDRVRHDSFDLDRNGHPIRRVEDLRTSACFSCEVTIANKYAIHGRSLGKI